MGYELKQTDIWNFANTFRTELKQKGDELFFKECPYCRGGGHDKHTFSINLRTGVYKCFRSSCGKQGHFVQLCRDFGYRLEFDDSGRTYKTLPQKPVETKPAAVKYLESRGIGEAVAKKYHITTRKDNESIMVFPFYDEKGVLTFVKYRNTKFRGKGNKEWCEKDTKPVLFGMEQCEGFERLIITEGQIDSLSLAQCGVKNAVSVPTGAMGFTWLANVWDWIIKFEEIIVFGDHERGKMTLLDELQRRLPNRVKAVRLEDYLGEKDANDILRKYGKQAILDAIERAEIPPIRHVKELADVEAVDLNSLPKINTNIQEIDKLIGGLYFGQVVLLTGKRGEGKSTFMGQLIVEALDQDYPVFAYSGELADYHFKRWLDFQAAGADNIETQRNGFGDETYSIPKHVVEKINGWYRGKAYIYDNNAVDGDELEDLLTTIERAVKQYGIKLICVDNLMTALDVDLNDNLYQAQSRFVKGLKKIAVKYDAVVILVAHPRKSKDKFDNDDVAGSADITNRVDVVMVYSRSAGDDGCDGKLGVTKNRLTGRLTRPGGEIELYYSQSTKRITSISSKSRKYGWEKGFDRLEPDFDILPF